MPAISGNVGAVFNGGLLTPPGGTAGLTITPVNPNATGSDTTALEIVLPQGAAPNFPNIYALIVHDPDTGANPFAIGSDGSVILTAQPFASPLTVFAASANPNGRTFSVFDTTNDEAIRVADTGAVTIFQDVGFYGTAPIAQQTGVAVSAAGIHAALVNLGLITT